MSVEGLNCRAIAHRNRTAGVNHNIIPCRVCGHTFAYRGRRHMPINDDGTPREVTTTAISHSVRLLTVTTLFVTRD